MNITKRDKKVISKTSQGTRKMSIFFFTMKMSLKLSKLWGFEILNQKFPNVRQIREV